MTEADFPKFHLDAFERIPPLKRKRIMEVATAEFAAKGYVGANINDIAKNASVSVGSMYNYFESKEALLLSVVDRLHRILEDALNTLETAAGTVFDKLEMMLRAVQDFARENPELNQVYLNVSSEGLAHISDKLSLKLEDITARFYRKMLKQAVEEGLIDPTINEYIVSFCLDNLILIFQHSNSSSYFKERMKVFVGEDLAEDDELVIQGIMAFIRRALSCSIRQ
ncbi:MAG: TetR/AcrR family transcriptional regulator [Deltaproteobacteria bacterium]|nr:TetR/AcrR family transcriptional regulator [Deltaproteobacteria bacterium]